jgi:hypothetical protein
MHKVLMSNAACKEDPSTCSTPCCLILLERMLHSIYQLCIAAAAASTSALLLHVPDPG